MPGHDIIVIGASAGGVEALIQLVADLPPNLPAAIFVVVHFPAWGQSILPQLLNREGFLHADHAKNDEKIELGRIYVAPPDYHLLVKRGYIRLVQEPKENNTRPAVDPLFRTAGRAYKRRVVGVVLSGTLDDGTAGLIDLKRQGGVAVVQDLTDAFFSGMPKSAIEHADVDFILPLSSIAPALVRLAHEPVAEEAASTVPSESEFETNIDVVEVDKAALRELRKHGTHSGFTCPDCGSSLFQLNKRGLLQYRCLMGHAYSTETLITAQSQTQEEVLWVAIRSLQKRVELMYKMAKYSRERNQILSAKRYEAQAKQAEQRSDFVRQWLDPK